MDFLELLGRAAERFSIIVHSFCLMNNHFHLIIETPEGNLSKAMHLLESCFVQRFNRRNATNGPLYQNRFYSKLIEQDDYLYQAILYVMRNPLKAGIVEDLRAYEWSSYTHFMAPEISRPEWLSTRGLEMGGIRSPSTLHSVLHRLDDPDQIELDRFPQVIGSDSFIAAALTRATTDDETIGHLRRALIRPSFGDIEGSICSIFGSDKKLIRQPSPGRRAPARMVAVLLAQELGGFPLALIAERYEFSNPRSAGVIAARSRQLTKDDAVFAHRVEQVRQVLRDGRHHGDLPLAD